MWVVTGAESSGKSTLASALAQHFDVPLVPEVARSYLHAKRGPDYGPDDVRAIAREQSQVEAQTLQTGAPAVVIADTDQRVIDLWWQEKYPALDSGFERAANEQLERYYLLCYPDLPWEADPLRENPHDRLRLYRLQCQALVRDNAMFRVIWGHGEIRTKRAWHWVAPHITG